MTIRAGETCLAGVDIYTNVCSVRALNLQRRDCLLQ